MKKIKIYFWRNLPTLLFKETRKKYKKRLNDYINVYVFNNDQELYDFCDEKTETKDKRNYVAKTFNESKYKCENEEFISKTPYCGWIAFNYNFLNIDTISHEVCHAVLYYFAITLEEEKDIMQVFNKKTKEIDVYNNLNQELFCYMVGNMSNEIAYLSVNDE